MRCPQPYEGVAPFVIAFQSDFFVDVDLWRRSGIVVKRVPTPQSFKHDRVGRRHRKGRDISPLRTQEVRGDVRTFVAALVDEFGQLQGLPAVGEEHVGIARLVHDQVPIHRVVIRVLVVDDFKRSVLQPIGDVLFGEVVSQGGGPLRDRSVGVVRLMPGRVVAEHLHLGIDVRGDAFRSGCIGKSMLQQAVRAIADAQATRIQPFFGGEAGVHSFKSAGEGSLGVSEQPRLRSKHRVLAPSRPCIVHERGCVPKVSGVNRRSSPVVANAQEGGLIPQPCDAVGFQRRETFQGLPAAVQTGLRVKARTVVFGGGQLVIARIGIGASLGEPGFRSRFQNGVHAVGCKRAVGRDQSAGPPHDQGVH